MQPLRMLRLLCAGAFTVLSLFLAASTPLALAQTKDSEQISNLLSQARTQSWQAAQDADILQSFTNSPMSWETHAAQLKLIQNDINDLAKTTIQLNDLRQEGSVWQQMAIDRINPLLRDMDETLSGTMRLLSAHPGQVNLPPYREYAHANYDVAREAASVISDFVAYGKSKGNSVALKDKLEIPPASTN